jgi:WD40 repeat protein
MRRMTGAKVFAAAAALCLALVVGLTALPSSKSSASVASPTTFLTVASSGTVHGRYIHLRSVRSGRILKSFVKVMAPGHADAVLQTNGKILAAVTNGYCTSTLERINPSSARVAVLRRVTPSINDLSLSPNGRDIAYVTYPSCRAAQPSDAEMFFPNILVVESLKSGTSVRTSTDMPGHPFYGLSWSPDSKNIAIGYSGNVNRVLILSASHPRFKTARPVPWPKRCIYFAPSWTKGGLVLAEGCGQPPQLSVKRLVEVTTTGTVIRTWNLPSCSDGLSVLNNQDSGQLIVSLHIGFGNGACGRHFSERVAEVVGTRLRTIYNTPN